MHRSSKCLSATPTRRRSRTFARARLRCVPTLLVYGGRDHIVEPKYGAIVVDALRARGTPVAYLEIPWADHAFDEVFNGPSSQIALYYTERFIAKVTQ